uniref:Sorting nexin n=1 Tax=Ciona savignyi TaxID=51511 RepID=H2ZEV1_CIOSA
MSSNFSVETVRSLYDFDGDVNNGELCFSSGEIITVTNKEVGEGWWEGHKADGTVGLFPETYVEAFESTETIPQPATLSTEQIPQADDPFGFTAPFPSETLQPPSNSDFGAADPFSLPAPSDAEFSNTDDIFGLGIPAQSSNTGSKPPTSVTSPSGANDEDILGLGDCEKSWEEAAVEQSAAVPQNTNNDWNAWENTNQAASAPQQPDVSPTHSQRSQGSVVTSSLPPSSPIKRTDRKTTIRVGNFITSLTKTAAESFVLGENNVTVSPSSMIQVIPGLDGPMWENNPQPFTCSVTNPVKESKFSGLKSFIAYTITPSHTNASVPRRFKHFDWLYEQLVRKFGVSISVPQLPDKQITGRYEDDFIEGRRVQLQTWLCRIALHPVISRSDVFAHFVTSKEDEKAWKQGKRKAEKDEAVGGAFF